MQVSKLPSCSYKRSALDVLPLEHANRGNIIMPIVLLFVVSEVSWQYQPTTWQKVEEII